MSRSSSPVSGHATGSTARRVTTPPDVAGAYAVCAEITHREARNFSYGIALLPPAKRQAMTAVYAMARRIDDIGDGDLPAAVKHRLLKQTRAEMEALARRESPDPADPRPPDPVLVALADACARLPIPVAAFGDLIDGCTADVDGRRYEQLDDLVWYCRRVAGSVGRLSVGVYDAVDARGRTMALADDLGVALQLTNILRDVREDRQNGRIYLPQTDLDRFGCTLALDADGNVADPPDRFAALLRFEADRARSWYDTGLRLLPSLDHRSAACTAAMAGIYRRLLDRIARSPGTVTTSRLSLSGPAKLRVAVRAVTLGRA
jgi:15-cis-phytoene synthase